MQFSWTKPSKKGICSPFSAPPGPPLPSSLHFLLVSAQKTQLFHFYSHFNFKHQLHVWLMLQTVNLAFLIEIMYLCCVKFKHQDIINIKVINMLFQFFKETPYLRHSDFPSNQTAFALLWTNELTPLCAHVQVLLSCSHVFHRVSKPAALPPGLPPSSPRGAGPGLAHCGALKRAVILSIITIYS